MGLSTVKKFGISAKGAKQNCLLANLGGLFLSACTNLIPDAAAGLFSTQQTDQSTAPGLEKPQPMPSSNPQKPPDSNFGQITFEIADNVFPETVRGYIHGFQNMVKVERSQAKTFFIDPVPPGKHDLWIFAYSRSSSNAEDRPRLVTTSVNSALDADAFEVGLKISGLVVEKGTTIKLGQLDLGRLYEIQGSVALAGAQVPVDIQVKIDSTEFSTFTDASGHYRITGIPRGQHTLKFSKYGYGDGRIEAVELGADSELQLPRLTLVRRQNKETFATFNTLDFTTDNPRVEVVLGAPDDARYMQISESQDFENSAIKALQTSFEYEFKTEGQKQLFIKFFDSRGEERFSDSSSLVQTRPITFHRYIVKGNPVALLQPSSLLEEPVADLSVKIPSEAKKMKLWDQNQPEPEWAPVTSQVRLQLAPEMGERNIFAKFLNQKGSESKTFNVAFALNPIIWVARFFTGICFKKNSCGKNSLLDASVQNDDTAIALISRGEVSLIKAWDTGEEIASVDSNALGMSCVNSAQQRPLFFRASGSRSVVTCLIAEDPELEKYSGLKILSFADNLALANTIQRSFQSAISVSHFVFSHLAVTDSGYHVIASQTADLHAKISENAVKTEFMRVPGDSENMQGHGTVLYSLSEAGNFSWKKLLENFKLLDMKVTRSQTDADEELVLLGNLLKDDKIETWVIVLSQRGVELWRKRLEDLVLGAEVVYDLRVNETRGYSVPKIELQSVQKTDSTIRLRHDQIFGAELMTTSFLLPSEALEGRLYAVKAFDESVLVRHGSFLSKVSRLETPKRLLWSHRLSAIQEEGPETHSSAMKRTIIGSSNSSLKGSDMIHLYENEPDAVSVIKLRNW